MRTITVTGVGRTVTAPDNIIINMTVNAQDAEYEPTMEFAAECLDALRAALYTCGFGKDDIRTAAFNVNTEYRHEHSSNGQYERIFAGYSCTHQLHVEFDLDMNRLAHVIAAISGCSGTPEFSVQFGVKDEDAVKTELLRSAAVNARARAEVLTAAADVSLGELVRVNYSMDDLSLRSRTNFAMPMMEARAAAKGAAMDFVPEEIASTENVTFVWEIK